MDTEIAEYRTKKNTLPPFFKEKFIGTPYADLPYIQSAIFRISMRIEDARIKSHKELMFFMRHDYLDTTNTQKVFNAILRGRITPDFQQFRIVQTAPDFSETIPRDYACLTDNDLILSILREDTRVKRGCRLPEFLEDRVNQVKHLYENQFPFPLPDGLIYDLLIEKGLSLFENELSAQ